MIAWGLSFTRITPNTVTLCSVLLGVAAGACAFPGTPSAFLLCALLYQASNCFDCADGQLARLSGRHSPEGRVYDGAADYAVNLCVYLGSLAGLVHAGTGRLNSLLLVAVGGAAMAFSCLFYDRIITRHERIIEGPEGEGRDEIEDALNNAASSRLPLRALWRIYALYLKLQGEQGEKRAANAFLPGSEASKRAYSDRMFPLLMLWSFTGPSAHVLYFLVFAAMGKAKHFFAFSVLVGLATLCMLALQQLVDFRIRAKDLARD
jgi:hypothetical protein